MKYDSQTPILRAALPLLVFFMSIIPFDAVATSYWGYGHLNITCEPTGAGKVYASTDKTKASQTGNCVAAPKDFEASTTQGSNFTWYINTIPTDSRRYQFVGWRKKGSQTFVSNDAFPENGISDNASIYAASTEGGTDHVDKNTRPYYHPANWSTTFTLELVAVYEEIISQYVFVESENTNYITVRIDKPENAMGDEVTIYAHPSSYTSKFAGWKKDGVLIADVAERMENPKTFTVTEATKGTYTATYTTGYDFFRIVNKATGRVINGINDTGGITDFSSLALVDNADKWPLAGTVVEISTSKVSGGTVYDFLIQNFHSDSYYDTSTGVYVTIDPNVEDNTYSIHPNRQSIYMADQGGGAVSQSAVIDKDLARWYIEGFDKDLVTKENYFSVDPAELFQDVNDGWYYTTLRTSWNVKFLKTDDGEPNMKAYVVNSVDANGVINKTELQGDIIPKGLPVLLACKTNSTENNRMIPTNTAAAAADRALTTILKNSVKYFPNQPVPEAAGSGQRYYTLGRTSDGEVGFITPVTNTSTGLNGNRGYYLGTEAAMLYPEYPQKTLAQLLEEGETGKKYEVTDLTMVETATEIGNDDEVLMFCKDGGYDDGEKVAPEEGQIDYMASGVAAGKGYTAYDQSRWIMLRVPKSVMTIGTDLAHAPLTNVKGRFLNNVNPELLVAKVIEPAEDIVNYEPNLYIPASFAGTQTSPVNNATYFFVTPKPMEVANVKWAIWDGTQFITPEKGHTYGPKDASGNDAGLSGNFGVNQAYMKTPLTLESNEAYQMTAVIKLLETEQGGSAPRRAAGDVPQYVAWPTEMLPDQQIITGVGEVMVVRQKVSVTYYNIAGMPGHTPHAGLNIVVTRFSDGTSTAEKKIFN